MKEGYPGCVLVLSAHPDDAEICCGGTISKLRSKGIRVVAVNFTVSEAAERRSLRMDCARQAAQRLDYELVWAFDGAYDQTSDIEPHKLVRRIDELLAEFSPTVVISHTRFDFHHDHRCLSSAARSSMRRTNASYYEMTPSEVRTHMFTGFTPNVLVDISEHLAAKQEAIECYAYAGQSFRELRSAEYATIAAYYGLGLGAQAAEAFDCVIQRAHGGLLQ